MTPILRFVAAAAVVAAVMAAPVDNNLAQKRFSMNYRDFVSSPGKRFSMNYLDFMPVAKASKKLRGVGAKRLQPTHPALHDPRHPDQAHSTKLLRSELMSSLIHGVLRAVEDEMGVDMACGDGHLTKLCLDQYNRSHDRL